VVNCRVGKKQTHRGRWYVDLLYIINTITWNEL